MPPHVPSQPQPLTHPTLGVKLNGAYDPSTGTIEYRNLKYASIPGRWRDSIPLDSLRELADSNGIYDATRFGPSCPQKRGGQAWDLTLVGDVVLPTEAGQGADEAMDEFECLHVNITVINPATPSKKQHTGEESKKEDGDSPLLPVFIFLHGGGLSIGSNSWPQYSLRRFISLSARIGKPLIGVSMNYRLNVFGFLASSSLPSSGNLGFKDQVIGFHWVRRHIRGFGGDPRNVTAVGESAGAISLSTLMCSVEGQQRRGRGGGEEGGGDESGLWDRVVLMSGDVTLRKPRAREWHDEMVEEQGRSLGFEGSSKKEIGRRLREWDAGDLVERLPMAQHFCGFVNGEIEDEAAFLRRDVRLNDLGASGRGRIHRPEWCKEFVVGDMGDDVSSPSRPFFSIWVVSHNITHPLFPFPFSFSPFPFHFPPLISPLNFLHATNNRTLSLKKRYRPQYSSHESSIHPQPSRIFTSNAPRTSPPSKQEPYSPPTTSPSPTHNPSPSPSPSPLPSFTQPTPSST